MTRIALKNGTVRSKYQNRGVVDILKILAETLRNATRTYIWHSILNKFRTSKKKRINKGLKQSFIEFKSSTSLYGRNIWASCEKTPFIKYSK